MPHSHPQTALPATFARFLAGGFCLVGILLIAAGIVGLIAEYGFVTNGVRTTGQIVSVERDWAGFEHGKTGKYKGTRPRYEFRVTYRYADHSGSSHDGQLTTLEDGYRPGAAVRIQYLADAPERSGLAVSWWVGFGRAGGLVLIGAVLVVAGAFALRHESCACQCHDDSEEQGS
jgi:hypothetical protein